MKYLIILLLLLPSYAYSDTYKTKFNPFTNKLDYVNTTVSTATYATTLAPQTTFYFKRDTSLGDTYLIFDNIDTVKLFINSIEATSWKTSNPYQDVYYNGQRVYYNGQPVRYRKGD